MFWIKDRFLRRFKGSEVQGLKGSEVKSIAHGAKIIEQLMYSITCNRRTKYVCFGG